MDPNVMREYLVGLGFTVDQPQFAKFQGVLDKSHKLVEGHTSGILSQYLKWQGAVTGIFTTLSGAILGYLDKTAMAEQENRLFAQRMFMTESQAKRTRMALDALGQPLEAIAWDPELHGHFVQLIHDQERLQAMLGPNYLQQMRMVRDMRFELTRMQVIAQYIGMKFLSDVFKGLGLGDGNVLTFLQSKVEWLMVHGPELAQRLADTAVPVLRETWTIVKDLGEVLRLAGVAFTNMVGLLTGDRSLEGTNLTFEKIAGSIQHVVGWLAIFLEKIIDAEKLTIHLITAVELAAQGNRKGAMSELSQVLSGLNAGSGFVVGSVAGTAIGGMLGAEGGPLGIMGGAAGGGLLGGGAGALAGLLNPHSGSTRVPGGVQASPAADALFGAMARAYGLDEGLLRAVAQQESGGREVDGRGNVITSKAGARGIMQLMPATAAAYGVNPDDLKGNLAGGAHYLSDLMKKYGGDLPSVLAAYNMGETGFDRAQRRGSALPAETQNYVSSIMAAYGRGARPGGGGGGSRVQIDKVEVNVTHPGATAREVQDATIAGIDQRLGRETQRDLAELGGVYAY